MNPLNEALRVFQERREDAIVLPTMTGGNRWRELNGRETMDHPVSGAMGKASSIALGLCLAQPLRKPRMPGDYLESVRYHSANSVPIRCGLSSWTKCIPFPISTILILGN